MSDTLNDLLSGRLSNIPPNTETKVTLSNKNKIPNGTYVLNKMILLILYIFMVQQTI